MVKISRNLLGELIRFGLVGVGTLAIDVTVTTALYNAANLPAYLASSIGFLSGFFFNFPLNRKKVFQHTNNDRFDLRLQIILYVSLSLVNLGTTGLLTELIVTSGIAKIAIAKIIVTAVIAVWNFVLFKNFIFSKKRSSSGRDGRVLDELIQG